MNKYLKVGFAAIVLCGLTVGKIEAAPDTLNLTGTVTAIHTVSISDPNGGATTVTNLNTSSYTGASMSNMGFLTINNNNPGGFAVRFHSKNYANGFKDSAANAAAVLLLQNTSTNYPSTGISTGNVQSNTMPGSFVAYDLGMKTVSATLQGVSAGNIKLAGTAIGSSFTSTPYMRLTNTYSGSGVSDSNELRFTSPTQATIAQIIDIGMATSAKNSLFAGTFQDTIEVAIIDLEGDGDDPTSPTLYDESGASTSWAY